MIEIEQRQLRIDFAAQPYSREHYYICLGLSFPQSNRPVSQTCLTLSQENLRQVWSEQLDLVFDRVSFLRTCYLTQFILLGKQGHMVMALNYMQNSELDNLRMVILLIFKMWFPNLLFQIPIRILVGIPYLLHMHLVQKQFDHFSQKVHLQETQANQIQKQETLNQTNRQKERVIQLSASLGQSLMCVHHSAQPLHPINFIP